MYICLFHYLFFQLPAGWEKRLDTTGREFYVGHITKTTQLENPWLRPVANEEQVILPVIDNKSISIWIRVL